MKPLAWEEPTHLFTYRVDINTDLVKGKKEAMSLSVKRQCGRRKKIRGLSPPGVPGRNVVSICLYFDLLTGK